ncbi:CHAT domain-containing protein [Aquabacterium sp.]|uniref:CHAT domain-containing tetratricopeptide repeat protein n=1 Tax=Aquabacterium sp. TaxID=1872578 RepID=UPI0037836940
MKGLARAVALAALTLMLNVSTRAATDPCDGRPPADAATLAAEPEALLRNDPAAAVARACSLRAAHPGVRATLALVQALSAEGRFDEAGTLLASLPAPPADQPALAAEQALAHAGLASDQNRYAEAGPWFEQAIAALQRAGLTRSLPYARALLGREQTLRTLRQTPDALARASAALEEAIGVLEQGGHAVSRDMGDALNHRTMLAYAQQDLPAAIAHARAEVTLARRLDGPDTPEAFDALASLGAMLAQLRRFDEAEAALDDGLRLMALHPDIGASGQLGVLNNLAALQLDRGRYDAALARADQSLALARRAFPGNALLLLVPMSHRAQALMSLSRLAEAQAQYETARALTAGDPSVPALRRLRLLDNLADLYLRLNDAEAARQAIAEGLQVAGTDAHFGYWRGRLLRQQATLAAAQGRWAEVDALHAEAAPLIAAAIGEQHPYVEDSTVQRCLAQLHGPLPGNACAVLQQRAAAADSAAPAQRFRVHNALALADERAGRPDGALQHHLQALAAAQSAGTAHPLWVAYDALALHLRQAGTPGRKALAIAFGKAAVEQIERMRQDFPPAARESERGFVADKLRVYRRLADWLAEDQRLDEALQTLRLLKREEFQDFVRGEGVPAVALPRRWLTPAEAQWRAQAPADAPEAAQPATALPSTAQPEAVQPEAARVAAWQALLREASAAPGPAPRAAMATPTPRAAPAAAPVRRGELQAWLFAADGQLRLLLDSRAGRRAQVLPVDPAGLARQVGQVLARIAAREDALPLLQSLHAQLAAPLVQAAQAAGAQRLVLHLDGVLRYLPFAALHDGHRYLGERFAIEQRVAGLADTAPALPAADATPYVQAFGVSQALAGLPALQAVADEVCGIVDGQVQGLAPGDGRCARGAVPGAAWLNQAFTAERLRRATESARSAAQGRRQWLHLGTHFVLRPGHIGKSWLLTGDAGRLQLDELAGYDLHGQALVTLSACETGLGGAEGADGRELDGLAGVLARRGAAAVVASLWRVEDRSTSLLMRSLYRALRQGSDPAQALQAAQRRVREQPGGAWRHPFYWAGFALTRTEP